MSTVTPNFYYFFIIFLTCYISVPSFIYNLCQVLLLGNRLRRFPNLRHNHTRSAAPHSALHLRFPIEKKKNFTFTRDLFYRLFESIFSFLHVLLANKWIGMCACAIFILSLVMHSSQWYLGRVSTPTRKSVLLTTLYCIEELKPLKLLFSSLFSMASSVGGQMKP